MQIQDNPYGLASLWQQGDVVIKTVAALLLLMSVMSWTIILFRAWRLWQQYGQRRRAINFWHITNIQEGLSFLGKPSSNNLFRFIVQQAHDALRHHQSQGKELQQHLPLKEWIDASIGSAIEQSHQRLNRGLGVLASVGSTAPFIGLFGTVWGIYHALVKIALTGQSNLTEVAGPVGETLTMTAFGLAVAIPAVLAYNALLRANRNLLGDLKRFAHNLQSFLLTRSSQTLIESTK